MNKYRLLALSLLGTLVLLIIATFQTQAEEGVLILRFERKVNYSLVQFGIFVVAYCLILSGLSFWASTKANLSLRWFWIYVALLVLPLSLYTFITLFPQWSILLFFGGGHKPGFYYDYINNYGIFNIGLMAVNVLGLIIFGLDMMKKR